MRRVGRHYTSHSYQLKKKSLMWRIVRLLAYLPGTPEAAGQTNKGFWQKLDNVGFPGVRVVTQRPVLHLGDCPPEPGPQLLDYLLLPEKPWLLGLAEQVVVDNQPIGE